MKKIHKKRHTKITSIILAVGMLMLGIVMEGFAAGTPAGTVIQSRSRATYTTASGAIIDTVYSNVVSFTVSQIPAFNVTPASNQSQSTSDSSTVDYALTIINSGNGADKGLVSAVSSKGWVTQIYFDANGDGVLQSGEIVPGTISQTSSLAADAEYKIVLRVLIPRGDGLDGEKDSTTLTVISNFNNPTVSNGLFVTTVKTANLGIPTSLVVDNPIPNAATNVVFTIHLSNTGSVSATGVLISNFIPSDFTFVSGATTQGTFNGSLTPATWNVGTIPAGGSITASITLMVKSSVVKGTVLGNQMMVNYTVGANTYSIPTNISQVTVAGAIAYGVDIVPMWTALTKEAADTAVYRYKIQNTGTIKDAFTLSVSSTRFFSWNLFKDVNNNTLLDGSDIQITSTDSLAAGDSSRVFARTIISRQSSAIVNDTLTVIATSLGSNVKKDTATTITTIHSPVISISKNVFPVGDQPPGTEMTYSISYSNPGNVGVSNFSIVDSSPAATTYMANSIKVNGTSVLDNNPQVSVADDGNGNKVIAVNIGTLNAHASGSIEFKVKIK